MQVHERASYEYHKVSKTNLKRTNAVWFQEYNSLEKVKQGDSEMLSSFSSFHGVGLEDEKLV